MRLLLAVLAVCGAARSQGVCGNSAWKQWQMINSFEEIPNQANDMLVDVLSGQGCVDGALLGSNQQHLDIVLQPSVTPESSALSMEYCNFTNPAICPVVLKFATTEQGQLTDPQIQLLNDGYALSWNTTTGQLWLCSSSQYRKNFNRCPGAPLYTASTAEPVTRQPGLLPALSVSEGADAMCGAQSDEWTKWTLYNTHSNAAMDMLALISRGTGCAGSSFLQPNGAGVSLIQKQSAPVSGYGVTVSFCWPDNPKICPLFIGLTTNLEGTRMAPSMLEVATGSAVSWDVSTGSIFVCSSLDYDGNGLTCNPEDTELAEAEDGESVF